MIPKKLDKETAEQFKFLLAKLNITDRRVTIDLDNETIELEDDYSIDDILESAGVLTPERAKELQEEVSRMREEWDS
ncbi:hypothetical protein P4S83_08390 [Aneurinibacillus thermoaerophilus]|jgi:hypothetical protein|uniref:hypothetical protein n=2 Tax=Paenibacillaceae TaxID=186822 RepID=UPI00037819F1|nr:MULTISPECIES: hypothetical protein [Paenibacillaceae]MED0680833.1 hypothetical protein [Aneurinibacillus thermoaerophilus]MED0763847.1 hypothetical protein [Aneurinibacillus thermoaerophilus]